MEENKVSEEQLMRVNIKQTAKKEAYFDVTVRGNTEEELKERLHTVLEIAKTNCNELNSL